MPSHRFPGRVGSPAGFGILPKQSFRVRDRETRSPAGETPYPRTPNPKPSRISHLAPIILTWAPDLLHMCVLRPLPVLWRCVSQRADFRFRAAAEGNERSWRKSSTAFLWGAALAVGSGETTTTTTTTTEEAPAAVPPAQTQTNLAPPPSSPGTTPVPSDKTETLQFPNSDVVDVLRPYENITGKKLIMDNFVQGKVKIFQPPGPAR